MNSKIESANLNPNSKGKIKPAFELASSIGFAEIPEELGVIKQFTE